ncbi:MAG: haloacid dehalogenase type II [bacterium]|nr:haloacid dehalogenase type II [bacterium]
MSGLDLTTYDTLSFDCYGTLIDWDAGIVEALQPLFALNVTHLDPVAQLEIFGRHESALQQADPTAGYTTILRRVHQAVAAESGLKTTPQLDAAFGDSVADWPAFEDSHDALARLATRYRLVILSNIDDQSFAASARHLGVEFDAVYTAQTIGSYKPDPANFEYLLRRESGYRVLHVAQSLFHDHAPAKAAGMDTVWIDRGSGEAGGATPPAPGATYDMRFESMADFADAAGV